MSKWCFFSLKQSLNALTDPHLHKNYLKSVQNIGCDATKKKCEEWTLLGKLQGTDLVAIDAEYHLQCM